MRTFAFLSAFMLVISSAIIGATPAMAWQQQPQQNCHYNGHYDQNGQLHTDGMICDQQQEGDYPSYQQQEYHPWHRGRQEWQGQQQYQPRVCYDQFDENWNRFRVCM